MSEDQIKLVAKLPKGELDGFAAGLLAEQLCTAVAEGHVPPPMSAILILDVKKVEVDPDTGERTAHLRIRRSQPVLTPEGRKAVETVLFDEYAIENGPVLPFDVNQITKAAFVDLPRSLEEVDQREAREAESMSPADELRRHLERVHGRSDAVTMTDGEAEERHRKDHDGDELPVALQHDPEWIGWTRADIEAAEAENEDFDTTAHPSDEDPDLSQGFAAVMDQDGVLQMAEPSLLFSDPGAEHLDDEDEPEDDDLPTRVV